MDIQAFFQLCDGKWVSQRTTHQLLEQNNQSGRSDLWGESLEADDSAVVTLCRQANVDPTLVQCGLRLRWSEVAEAYQSKFKPKNEGAVVLVAIAADASHSDQMLRSLNGESADKGTYSIGVDEALTIRFEEGGASSEERIWFASPNLRLRSSSVKQDGVVCITTFCSEIRMGGAAAPPAEPTAAQSSPR